MNIISRFKSKIQSNPGSWFTRLSFLEGLFFAFTVASSEAYGLYFYAKNDTSPLRIGLLTTLPLLFSAIGQLIIPKRVTYERLRPTIIILIFIQLVGLGFILSCAYHLTFWKMLLGSSLYWIGGQNLSPLWMDWASEQIDLKSFPNFLAKRNMVVTIICILIFSGASFWLDNVEAFKIVFLIGLICRVFALVVQIMMFKLFPQKETIEFKEEIVSPDKINQIEMMTIVKKILIPLTLFRFGVNVASPFFLPFMTHEIKLNTSEYALLSIVPLIARLFFLQSWAKSGSGLRPFWGIQVCALAISFLPGLWALWSTIPHLIVYQLMSGLFWSGMEICSTLMVQNLAKGKARIIQGRMLAMNTGFTLLGTICGGLLLEYHYSYAFVFTLSSILRLLSAIWLYFYIARYPRLALNKKIIAPYLATVLSIRPTLAGTAKFIIGHRKRTQRENTTSLEV